MMRSLFSGVSGLKVHQTRMDSIGNNIANINSAGFKSSRTTFTDILSQTQAGAGTPTAQIGGTNPRQIGLGVNVASIDILFTDGAPQATGKNTDMALSGNALFVVKNGDQTYYTRDGAFEFDAEGNFVLPGTGLYVQGWTAVDGALNTNAQPENIVVPAGKTMNAAETNRITYNGNLDAGDPLISTISYTNEDGETITLDPNKSFTLLAGELASTENINKSNWEELIALVEDGNGLIDSPTNGVINVPDTVWGDFNLDGPADMSDDQVASKISDFITELNANYLRNRHNADDQAVTLTNTSKISKKKLTTDYSAANESNSAVKVAMANAIDNLNGIFANLQVIDVGSASPGSYDIDSDSMSKVIVSDWTTSGLNSALSIDITVGNTKIDSNTSPSTAKGVMSSLISDLNKTIRSLKLDVGSDNRDASAFYLSDVTSETENAAAVLTEVRSIQFTADGSDLYENYAKIYNLAKNGSSESDDVSELKILYTIAGRESVVDFSDYIMSPEQTNLPGGNLYTIIQLYNFIKAKAYVMTNSDSATSATNINTDDLYDPFWATISDVYDETEVVANVAYDYRRTHNGYDESTNLIGYCNINSTKYNDLISAIDATDKSTISSYQKYYNNSRDLYNHLQATAYNSAFATDGSDLLVIGDEDYLNLLELIPGNVSDNGNPAADFAEEYAYTAVLTDYLHARQVQTATEYNSIIIGKNLTVIDPDTGEELDLDEDSLDTHYNSDEYKFRTATSAFLTLSDGTRRTVTTGTYHVGDSVPITTVITVFDSEGGEHKVPIILEKVDANRWMASLANAHKSFTDSDDSTSLKVTEIDEDDGSQTTITMRPIYIYFNGDGTFSSGSSDITLEYESPNGADTTQATVDFSSLTQFDGNSTAYPSADGNKAGVLTSVAIDSNGIITGTYTNGLRQQEAQVAVAQFTNPGGLTKTGNTFWQESNNSGSPNVQTAPDLGIGITPSALEMSNVDLANEFSEMIITQRGFQANSKIINVGDEMLETLVNMKR